jgi:hypothetical protein
MTNFEDQLRDSLCREEPPLGFSKRVLRRVPDERPHGWRRRVVLWTAAAMTVIAVGGTIKYSNVQRAREERARGEAAAEQVREALRITGSKLHVVQAKFKEMGS